METKKARSTPQSRRERPAKPALSRQGIVEAALTILRDEGLEKVTMRRIATALDTGPASLYVYVRDTEDLHAQILDALLDSGSEATLSDGTWQERLKMRLTSYMYVLFKYPEMARMAMSTQPTGPHYLALVDTILALLNEGGVPDREAAWAVDLLLQFATANAVEHGLLRPTPQPADEESALILELVNLEATLYPQIARLGAELFGGTGLERFEWSLDVLLAGVSSTHRPPNHD
ncbi:MAG: TetR/AcrR family transcriptional regulator [Chloroflexota bacterium]